MAELNLTTNLSDLLLDSCGRQQSIRVSGHHDSIWLTRITFPLFLVAGSLGNVVGIVLVLKERLDGRRRRSAALDSSRSRKTFLLALFSSDLCYLWNRLVLLLSAGTWDEQTGSLPFFIWTHGALAFFDALLSFSSQGILVAFSVDRFYALTAPLQHQSSISARRRTSMIAVGFIFLSTACCSIIIPSLYYWHLINDVNHEAMPRSLFRWRIFDAWFEVIVRVSTALVILILNRLIFIKIRQSKAKLSVHLHLSGPRRDTDPELTAIMGPAQPKTSKTAIKILFFSSVFYLVTNALEIVVSFLSVMSMYPLCMFQLSSALVNSSEPARDFLRHSYFAFGFVFYVCLKLRTRYSLMRRRSSAPFSSDVGSY